MELLRNSRRLKKIQTLPFAPTLLENSRCVAQGDAMEWLRCSRIPDYGALSYTNAG